MTREYKYFVTDAFTDISFIGNPSGIVLTKGQMTDEEMQKAARELKHAETTCIQKLDTDIYDVRYFSPVKEVKLSAHAALSTFWTLAALGYISDDEREKRILQHTKMGKLNVFLKFHQGKIIFVDVELPQMSVASTLSDLEMAQKAFSLEKEALGISGIEEIPIIDNGMATMLIPIKERDALYSLKPKRRRMEEIAKAYNIEAFHLFYYNKESRIVEQRNFSPTIGIWEDAASGTGSGAMYFYLKEKGLMDVDHIKIHQGENIGRPSEIFVSERNGRVYIGGRACVVMEGIMRI